jgi:hypothetical protein
MSLRHCATEGCPGTLPPRKGKHCPRCGGTEFLKPRRARRWVLVISASLVVLAALAITIGLVSSRDSATAKFPTTPQRQALMDARDLAAKMTVPIARDEAFAEVIHRALAEHDFEYACQLGNEMSIPTLKDKSLLEIVDEALKGHQTLWANRAADLMVVATNRDAAFRKIMDTGADK